MKRARHNQRGITLVEMLIVTVIIGLVSGIMFPSVAAGIDLLRLRSAASTVASGLSAAIDRAERRQQVIEVWISPEENIMIARSPDLAYQKRIEIPESVRITQIEPLLPPAPDGSTLARRFLMYPGGTLPRIGIELAAPSGRRRWIRVDPLTGMAQTHLDNAGVTSQ